MKIIILGAGQVGTTVAEMLAGETNDITVVDNDVDKLNELKDRLDIRIISGQASYPDILRQAGAEDADMLIALTSSDETNMIACQVAYTLFHTPYKISRVRATSYLKKGDKLFNRKDIPVDEIISPHQEVTNYIGRLITYPGALQVLNFANDKVQLVGMKAYYGGPLVGNEIRTLREHIPTINTRVAAIYRGDSAIIPRADTIIEADDEVFFIAAKKDIRAVMSEIRHIENNYRKIVIVGGGNIGARLAAILEDNYQVKIIEHNWQRCQILSEQLNKAIVIHGDVSSKELLIDENIDSADVFCALTNNDEINIMSSMLAKKLGAGKVMTLINNLAYIDLVQGGKIDIAISPQQITVSKLLRYVRRGDIPQLHSLRRGAAEALEIIVRGDKKSSKVVGRTLGELNFPDGTVVGAVVRNDEVIIASHNVVVNTDDHVILFLPDKCMVQNIERLFQVDLSFF